MGTDEREEAVASSDALYEHPEYYELAFSFRDVAAEVSVLEDCMAQFSRIPVEHVLEFACGAAPHMPEFVRRGYAYAGVDLSEAMLALARQRAASSAAPSRVTLIQEDMTSPSLRIETDFACTLLGSMYVRNTAELIAHMDAAARCIRPGGLYVMDWCVDFDPYVGVAYTWDTERDGLAVTTTYMTQHVDRVEQVLRESILLDVNDHGRRLHIEEHRMRRAVYPQEFLALLRLREDFEFVGWWNAWDLSRPLAGEETIERPLIVIRRNEPGGASRSES